MNSFRVILKLAVRNPHGTFRLIGVCILTLATVRESNNEDGSDAEIEHEERNENGNPESIRPAPTDSTGPNSHEINYTAGHDDQDDDLEPLNDLINNALSRSSQPRVSSVPTITRDKADEINGDGEAATPAASTPQAANVSIRRGMSREQSWSLDPFADEGIFSSVEEEYFQDVRSVFLDFERLKASVKKVSGSREKCVRKLNEDNAAWLEKGKQILSNPNMTYEDSQPVMDRILYKLANNNKKRKMKEDDNGDIERFAASLEGPGKQAFLKKASQ